MSFRDLDEHKLIADLLRRSLQRGRLAHAYLFSGPRGTGKEQMARTLAKALNCTEKDHDSCDRCDSCRRIEGGTHPDIYWVRPQSKSRRITVEQIREFESAVYLKPSLAQIKVGVIVDADCMGEEASNAFLKTLEEPPAQTIIILLSAEPQRLLPTILSRCLRISFGQTKTRQVQPFQAGLVRLLAAGGRDDGRVARAYQLQAGITGILNQLREQIRTAAEAEADLDRYQELEPKALERLEEQLEARIEGEYRAARELVLEEMYGWHRDVLLCVEGGDRTLLEHGDEQGALQEAATGLSHESALANLESIEQIREALHRNISEPLAFEVGLLKLTR